MSTRAFGLDRDGAPRTACLAGIRSTRIGADRLTLAIAQHLGAPVTPIGGAGPLHGVLVMGVITVALTGLPGSLLAITARPTRGRARAGIANCVSPDSA